MGSKKPLSRKELLDLINKEDKARWNRIKLSFSKGFKFLKDAPPSVTVFGSARTKEDHPSYELTRKLGRKIAEEGFAVVTGGAGGLMEAANRGAMEAGGESIGVNIILPKEQHINPYLTKSVNIEYFFSRKVFLAYGTNAIVACPGGFGTLDELFEVLTLLQTNKIPKIPVILLGKDFWEDVFKTIEDKLLNQYQTISKEDLKLFTITDSIKETIHIIHQKEQKDLSEAFNQTQNSKQ